MLRRPAASSTTVAEVCSDNADGRARRPGDRRLPSIPVTDMAERVERFRDAFFALDAATLRDGVRQLPKAVSAPLHTAAGTPFPALGRLPDPRTALRRVKDLPLLSTLADVCV